MQQRIETAFDQQIEDRGWERIRSKVVVETRDGRSFERWADENYRGSPHNPLSDAEVEGKFRDCAAGLLDEARIDARSEEHTSELQSLMRISYAVFCLKKNKKHQKDHTIPQTT